MSLTQVIERLQEIDTRLSNLENKLNADNPIANESRVRVRKRRGKRFFGEESRLSIHQGNLLGYVAVLCFVVAAGCIIKLSLDSGWLTPEKQMVLPLLLGVALIGSGFKLLPLDEAYASLLPAAGIIVLYLTTFAAHRLYFLISFQTALVISTCISGLCIWLYLKINHDVYSLVASTGAYLSPVLLNFSTNAEFSLFYYVLCSCTFAIISIWAKSRTLTVFSAYLAFLISGLEGLKLQMDGFMATILALNFIVFATGTYFYTQQMKKSLTEYEAFAMFPALVMFYAMEYFYLDRVCPALAPWISIGFALLLMGLYLSAKKWFPDRVIISQSLIIAFSTLVFFHSVYIELLPNNVRPWTFVGITLGFVFLPPNLLFIRRGPFFRIPFLAIFIILLIEYTSMVYHLLENANYAWILVSLASFASIWLIILVKDRRRDKKGEHNFLLLAAAHLLGILAFYQLAGSSLAVSASWLFYAFFVISYAFFCKDKVMANSALIILSVAAGKALLYDAASAPTIVRILCLLLTGMVLYACGFLIKKIATWSA